MSTIRGRFAWSYISRVCMILSAGVMAVSCPGMAAKPNNKTKPTEVPARIIAHLPMQEAAGGEMLLQKKGDKHYLYVQKASRQGFTVIDVTKPEAPSLLSGSASSNNATAGKLELVGPDVGLAEVRDQNAKGVIRSTDNPIETVKILDLSDPAHPKVLQTFTGVTSVLQDPDRGLIYLANNEGLWILTHSKPGLAPAKKKRPCGSEDALASMPPDCQ